MRCLVMMAKHPQPGLVKTRLASAIGDQAAAAVARTMIDHLLAELGECGDHRIVAASPADAIDPMRLSFPAKTADRWEWRDQGEGDLGARMERQFCAAMSDDGHPSGPADSVVMIGSDTPTVSAADIEEVFEYLETHHMVIGPAVDGGYWLIGFSGPWSDLYQSLFRDMTWSDSNVLEESIRRAEWAGLSIACLEDREDVDTIETLERLIEWIKPNPLATTLSGAIVQSSPSGGHKDS